MGVQILKCSVCQENVVYDPGSVIVSLNESQENPTRKEEKEVVAYLTCSNGHTKPYKVKK